MKKYENITVIFAAVTLAFAMLAAIITFTERMAVLEVQLTTIQRDITELGLAIGDIPQRTAQLEHRVLLLGENAGDACVC